MPDYSVKRVRRFHTPERTNNNEAAVPMNQPTGQLHQIPLTPNERENTNASTTRRIRSENVEIINGTIAPAPRNTPSALSLNEIST